MRRYVAVGPDDGRTDTVWGTGFFDNGGDPGSQAHPNSIGLVPKAGNFVPNRKLPVSADTDPNSAALDYYEAGQSMVMTVIFSKMAMRGLVILQALDCAATWQWDQMMVVQILYGAKDSLISTNYIALNTSY
ncbi:hypothetical protein [Enterococcus faecalis]|uniref:hypothetical protein n=1 Tax=Enterococcus faecalis TaxID=1351 RepID=UPI004038E822